MTHEEWSGQTKTNTWLKRDLSLIQGQGYYKKVTLISDKGICACQETWEVNIVVGFERPSVKVILSCKATFSPDL